jgi:hypothetical protein
MARRGMDRNSAERIAGEYQYLVGQKFDTNLASNLIIESVCLVPMDEADRYIFIRHYRDCGDIEQALKIYDGDLFDVVVLTHVVYDKRETLITDLGTYLFERNLVYDTDEKNEIKPPLSSAA